MDFYRASSLKQQYMGMHVAPIKNISLIPSQPVYALTPHCCKLAEKQQISIHGLV